jgi:hypothetical protein
MPEYYFDSGPTGTTTFAILEPGIEQALYADGASLLKGSNDETARVFGGDGSKWGALDVKLEERGRVD